MTPTQSPTLASQATAELPSLKADFEAAMHEYGSKLDFLVLEGSTRYAYMETEWAFRGYEAGRASRAQSEWISVKDRLPAHNVDVLVLFGGEFHGIAGLRLPHKGQMLWHGHSGSHNSVTHWAPIPRLPATLGETK